MPAALSITRGLFFSQKAPSTTKKICTAARSHTTGGKPASTKPRVVPTSTVTATAGLMNRAMNTATWLARVKLMGPNCSLTGEMMGIRMPTAHSSAAVHIFWMRWLSFIQYPSFAF